MLRFLFLFLVLLLASCSDDAGRRLSSGASCDESLGYEANLQPFFESYCLQCHSADVSGADRFGAPEGVDFDTLAGIRAQLELVDATAAAGQELVNEEMPPQGLPDQPSLVERHMLGAWLACGAPE